MSVSITVAQEFSGRVDRAELRRIALRTLRMEQAKPRRGVTLIIAGDRAVRRFNRRFHHTDRPTDVLAFPAEEKDYLGEVLISYETARENARAARWRIRDELDLLVIHGLLHLLGYDDRRPRLRARMQQREAVILGMRVPPIDKPRAKG